MTFPVRLDGDLLWMWGDCSEGAEAESQLIQPSFIPELYSDEYEGWCSPYSAQGMSTFNRVRIFLSFLMLLRVC